MKFSAAIVGLGAIGQGYDYHLKNSDDTKILTHASAFYQHPGFELTWGIDPAVSARMKFTEKFGAPAYDDLEKIPVKVADIISLCTPTVLHAKLFHRILNFCPKAIILEKPIGETLEESKMMVREADLRGCKLIVNFMRRFEPGAIQLRNELQKDLFGTVRKAFVWYAKGLLNNASHFINLLEYWFGAANEISVLKLGRTLANTDTEPDFRVRFGRVDAYFAAGNEEDFSVKEIRILTERGIIEYRNGGETILHYPTVKSATFANYSVLSENPRVIETDFLRYQKYTTGAAYEYLTNGKTIESDGTSALRTQEIIETIRNSKKEASAL